MYRYIYKGDVKDHKAARRRWRRSHLMCSRKLARVDQLSPYITSTSVHSRGVFASRILKEDLHCTPKTTLFKYFSSSYVQKSFVCFFFVLYILFLILTHRARQCITKSDSADIAAA